jgi:hypothetical protein
LSRFSGFDSFHRYFYPWFLESSATPKTKAGLKQTVIAVIFKNGVGVLGADVGATALDKAKTSTNAALITLPPKIGLYY